MADDMMADMICSGEAVESCSQVRERLGLEVTLNTVRAFYYRVARDAADCDRIM